MKRKKISMPVKIGIALALGIVAGLVCYFGGFPQFTTDYLKPFGTIFINLLKFIVVPVVLLSMISGIVSIGDIKRVGSVGWKAMLYFLATTAAACVIGLVIAEIFNKAKLFPMLELQEGAEWTGETSVNFMDTLIDIFPSNMWQSFSSANMLQVIVIAVLFGAGILLAGERAKMIADFVNSAYAVIEKVMSIIIGFSPVGVFAMIAWVVANQGAEILGSMALVLLCAYIGYVLHCVLIYSVSVKLFADMNPLTFFKKVSSAAIFAFTSASSAASLPIARECADDMGVREDISSFVLPIGCTMNMDGTAVYQCVATVFLAACCGMELTLSQMVIVVVTATVASIGTAGVSGAGMLMLAMVLATIGVPVDMIMIIYGIDRLFDMGRTALNTTGNIACSVCVNRWESKK